MPDTFTQGDTVCGYGAGYAYTRRDRAGVVLSRDLDSVRWHAIHSVGATRVMAAHERQGAPGYVAFVRFD